MKIQLLSDLHIEHFETYDHFQNKYKKLHGHNLCEKVYGEVLVLAGDIGNAFQSSYFEFLNDVSKKYSHVMIVAGNHEFYSNEYWSCNQQMIKVCSQFNNVHFLDRASIELTSNSGEKILFLGCALWSQVPDNAKTMVQKCMNDYHLINIKDDNNSNMRTLTVDDTNYFFNRDYNFLKDAIEKERNTPVTQQRKIIVVTHHAPMTTGVSSPYYENTQDTETLLINSAFASDLRHLMGSPVVLWISGHTHYSAIQQHNGTHIASNQLGYISFQSDDNDNHYREDLFFDTLQNSQ
ncbi:hypothetical protein C9374_006648 [Naegleria lovaniensis]|uniref:Calcineurin-like phosphoesterase domain-containing protein n=1 Tax=Naegleria lovaniensis TaxID=51637 RepID=A0AA88GLV5_NAELO|nr:uncharacterized protein C9374_006648 [Naegleria lovaniensis]KAG2379531.1 hypothetical protein C9374_006648 [Naegleria lovaniensis]